MADVIITKQELIDAQKDAKTLEDVINGAADTQVTARLGRTFWTLATLNSKLNSVETAATQAIAIMNLKVVGVEAVATQGLININNDVASVETARVAAESQMNAKVASVEQIFDDKLSEWDDEAQTEINEWRSAISLITQEGGVPALAVSDASGVTQQQINNAGVVAVDSIADLLALPEGRRKEGLRYLVKGYYAESDMGGGEFYWDSTSTVEPDQGVYFSLPEQTSGRFIRLIDGLTATTYWFGIPYQSFDVDNTARIQSLISLPRFAFPTGFKSSVSTLYPVSGTTGFFNDAVLTLLPGMPNFTPIISFELKGGEVPSHIYYYGGVLDGNRGAESGTGQGGQDGGLHCCRVYAGESIEWHDPVFQNAATDGIYVNQTGDGSVVAGVKFIRPDCNNNSRQGASIINCQYLEFEDGTFRNTNGKLPEAGIDVEPNSPSESVTVVFSGTTTVSNNAGRGFVMDSQGSISEYTVIFDRMDISGFDPEGLSLRITGGGLKKLIGNRLTMEGGLSFGGGFSLDFKCDYVSASALLISGRLDATTEMDVDIKTLFLDQTLNATAIDVRVLDYGGKYNLNLPNSYLRNSSLGASGSCANIHSNNNVTGFLRAFILPRVEGAATVNTAVLLSGDFSSKFSTEVNVREPIGYSSAIRVWEGSRGANITARKSSPDSDDLVRLDGSECIVDAVWEQASGRVVHIAGNSAEDNIVSVKAINASYTASLAGTPSYRNYLTNSVLSRDDGGTVLTGAGWVVSGSILNGVPS